MELPGLSRCVFGEDEPNCQTSRTLPFQGPVSVIPQPGCREWEHSKGRAFHHRERWNHRGIAVLWDEEGGQRLPVVIHTKESSRVCKPWVAQVSKSQGEVQSWPKILQMTDFNWPPPLLLENSVFPTWETLTNLPLFCPGVQNCDFSKSWQFPTPRWAPAGAPSSWEQFCLCRQSYRVRFIVLAPLSPSDLPNAAPPCLNSRGNGSFPSPTIKTLLWERFFPGPMRKTTYCNGSIITPGLCFAFPVPRFHLFTSQCCQLQGRFTSRILVNPQKYWNAGIRTTGLEQPGLVKGATTPCKLVLQSQRI